MLPINNLFTKTLIKLYADRNGPMHIIKFARKYYNSLSCTLSMTPLFVYKLMTYTYNN